jgi:hypothetical protein
LSVCKSALEQLRCVNNGSTVALTRFRPFRFMMTANARTAAATAASSGDAAKTASGLALSASASRSGLVMIQAVTARTFGAASGGAGAAVVPR